MKTPSLLLMFLLTGCAATITPNYDQIFGSALRDAKRQMVLNPDAGRSADQALGIDAKAARESITQYQNTFKTPPPVVNVINIGGGIGSAAR